MRLSFWPKRLAPQTDQIWASCARGGGPKRQWVKAGNTRSGQNLGVLRPCSKKRVKSEREGDCAGKVNNGPSCQVWQATPGLMNQMAITHWTRTQSDLRKFLRLRGHLLFIFEFSNRFNRLTVKTGYLTYAHKLQNLAKLQHKWWWTRTRTRTRTQLPCLVMGLVSALEFKTSSWAFVKESACE